MIIWDDVRHIKILDNERWFTVKFFDENLDKKRNKNKVENSIELEINDSYQPFFEDL